MGCGGAVFKGYGSDHPSVVSGDISVIRVTECSGWKGSSVPFLPIPSVLEEENEVRYMRALSYRSSKSQGLEANLSTTFNFM